jgi:hypothetical protein|tara:strand:- start:637 stop:852 length:216 start_codon:yes stop_codon:yes gene_type:complete
MSQIIEIKKNKTNYVQIELREYEGHPYVDVREFYDDEEGRRLPTKKGITFSPKVLDSVVDGLVQLQNEIKK